MPNNQPGVDTRPPTPAGQPRHHVAITITVDGETRIFAASVDHLTNIDPRDAVQAVLAAVYDSADGALAASGPWMPDPAANTHDPLAGGEVDYAEFLDVIRQADRLTGITVEEIANRLDAAAVVTRWVQYGLTAGDIEAAPDSPLGAGGLPLHLRLADDMSLINDPLTP